LYKVWYTEKELQSLLFRNSPVLEKLPKKRIGGRAYNYAQMWGRGGAVAGDATVAAANAASTARIAEVSAGIGKIFSVFNITDLEKMASQDSRSAYAPAAIAKMFAGTEGARKTLASSLYGSGFGELATINNGGPVLAGAVTMVVSSVIGFEVGTQFVVTTAPSTTGLPGSALVGGGLGTVYTVGAIDDATNTLTFAPAAPVATFVDFAWLCLNGCRDAGGNSLCPEGLGALVPSYFNRTGVNWGAYIVAPFRGVNRSVSTSRLAGNFFQRTGVGLLSDALVEGIRLCRRQGGRPDMIILNDADLATVTVELRANTNYMQMINTGDKNEKNAVTVGLEAKAFMFSTSYINLVLEDPFCPQGTAYILDSSAIDLVTITDAEKVLKTSIGGNEPGAPSVLEAKDVTGQPFQLNIEDYISIQPGALVADGAAAQVIINLFMNFALYNPAHCCVVRF
jgi:hypothetical protein